MTAKVFVTLKKAVLDPQGKAVVIFVCPIMTYPTAT